MQGKRKECLALLRIHIIPGMLYLCSRRAEKHFVLSLLCCRRACSMAGHADRQVHGQSRMCVNLQTPTGEGFIYPNLSAATLETLGGWRPATSGGFC